MIPAAVQGQENTTPGISPRCARTATAHTTAAAMDSHQAATGRRSASRTAPAGAKPIAKAAPGFSPPLSPSWATPPSATPNAARQTSPCGSQRSHTNTGSGSRRAVHRSSRSTRSARSAPSTHGPRRPWSASGANL